MKGTIIRIIENDYGMEFGFISDGRSDYYFDNRYLLSGSMSDFYVDDTVEFIPDVNPTDNTKKIAKNVVLTLGEIKAKDLIPAPARKAEKDLQDYFPPEDDDESDRWYKRGRSPKLVLKGFTDDEVKILDRLAGILKHTNAGHFRTREKGVNYGYSLFGPTKAFALQLGLEKVEFSMIMCDRKDFQRRTLEETFNYLTHYIIPKVRISGHFYVLITKYKEIVQQLVKPDIQGALLYSIIPFSYDELLTAPENQFESFVLQRFKRFLFERDYFSYSEPINDRLFLFGGRDTYAKGIADRCITGDHSGIFGLRKSGKTSVLNMVKQELEQRRIHYLPYRCVEITPYTWFGAIAKIVNDLYLKLGMNPPAHSYTETNAIDYFSEDVSTVLPQLENHLVLIFDEIEQISIDSSFDEKWQDPITYHLFWSTIINFCEKNPGTLSLIIAGINPSINDQDLVHTDKGVPPHNPMYKKLSNGGYLQPFVYEQTRRMVNDLGKYMGFKFDDSVCHELQRDFGGHPYFTRQMCKIIVEFVRKEGLKKDEQGYLYTVSSPLYNAIKESGEFEFSANQWCGDILKELKNCYPSEYQLLVKIANRDTRAIKELKKSVSIIPHLLGYGLVEYDQSSKEMQVSVDIVRNYLIRTKEYKKPFEEMSAKEIDDEIQDGVSACEVPIRKLIKDVLLTSLPREKAPEFIMSTKRFQKDNYKRDLTGYSVQQLLNPQLVTLHFYTLKDIICSYDSTFGDHFELFRNILYPYTKGEIELYLSNIYIARNTADHHYEVHNEGTLNNFRSSLSEILKILKSLDYVSEY